MAYEKGFYHKSLEQISIKNLVDDPVASYRGCYSDFRIMISQSSITQERKWL